MSQPQGDLPDVSARLEAVHCAGVRRGNGRRPDAFGSDDPLFLAAGKKHEVLAAIAAKLGLTFEQIKQSVLLAQGDFAEFLKAKGTESAQLLERMTGTEIYGRLSMRAAQKAQDAQQAVAAHQEAMAGFQPLGAEKRAALESSLADLKAKAAAQEALVKELEAGQRWYADLALRASRRRKKPCAQVKVEPRVPELA